MSAVNGGQLLVNALVNHGVQRVFCVPGESYLPVLDALYDSTVKTTVCRQEGGAAMMAEAWGKLTGQPGICFVTRGPGATNATAGLHIALQDSTPMILFIGQVGAGIREREAFQEVDYRAFLGSCVKWVAEIDDPSRMDEMIARAFHTATSGRPGPVALALPESTLNGVGNSVSLSAWRQLETHPGAAELQSFATMLQVAKRPLAIVGGSRWSAKSVSDFQDFAQAWQLPVACSFRRQMLFDHTHPNYAGDVGIGLNPTLRQQIEQADLLILLGTRFSEIPSQDYQLLRVPAPTQTLIHIYPGAEELGRVYQAELPIHASPEAMIGSLKRLAPPAQTRERGERVIAMHESYIQWSTALMQTPGEVQMSGVLKYLAKQLPADAIITNGAGNYASWIHRFWAFKSYGSQVAPTSGSMGYGLPAAIAAKLAFPSRTVVAFAGDGCFQMTMQEFGTAIQAQAAIIVVVIDNGMYGTIRMHQEKNYPGRVSGTSLHNPDFAALAKAYGVLGLTVSTTEQFPIAIQTAMQADAPSLIHVHLHPEAITPTATLQQMRDSALRS